jgi:hypothetical protein
MFRNIICVLAVFGAMLPASAVDAANTYESKILGKWVVDDEVDLFVFEDRNICFRMDEDGIKTSENGRWSATSSKLTTEVKYNGKKYRTVFKYDRVDADTYKLTIVTSLIDGKKQEVKKKEVIAKRWKEE